MKKLLAITTTVLMLTLSLGACTSGQKQTAGIAGGAVVGGLAGSAVTGGSVGGTVVGAAVGGVVGNEVTKP